VLSVEPVFFHTIEMWRRSADDEGRISSLSLKVGTVTGLDECRDRSVALFGHINDSWPE